MHKHLEPALLFSDVRGLDAVMDAQLLDRNREVVTDGTFGEKKRCGYLGNTRASRGGGQYRALLFGKRIIALAQSRHRQGGVYDPLTGNGPPDSRCELRGW